MRKLISIVVLILMIGSCTIDLNDSVTDKSLYKDKDCMYTLKDNWQFIAPCDCFDIGDILVKKV